MPYRTELKLHVGQLELASRAILFCAHTSARPRAFRFIPN